MTSQALFEFAAPPPAEPKPESEWAQRATKEERHMEQVESVLRISLSAAVPLWVDRFIQSKLTIEQVLRQAHDCGRILSEKGDVLMYGGKGCATAFNALACGLAAASFVPGGVKAFGLHFESRPEWLAT